MGMTCPNQVGILLALLLTLGGLLVLRSTEEEKAQRRFLLYLVRQACRVTRG